MKTCKNCDEPLSEHWLVLLIDMNEMVTGDRVQRELRMCPGQIEDLDLYEEERE